MLKFIQKSLVICSASLGLSELVCANEGWDLDWRGQPDLSSKKNQARWAQAQQDERNRQTREYEAWQDRLAAVRDKPLQYRPPHEDLSPAYIPAASYQGTQSSSDTIAPRQQGRINEPYKYYDSEDKMGLEQRGQLGKEQMRIHGMLNDMNQKPFPYFSEALRYFEQKTLLSLPPEQQVEWKQFVAEARAVNKAGNDGKHDW